MPDLANSAFGCGHPAKCVCTRRCEFPCWQRVGLTDQACCPACPPLPEVESAAA